MQNHCAAQLFRLSFGAEAAIKKPHMPKLKKLLIISFSVLFVIICLNIAGYYYSASFSKQREVAESGHNISAYQQVLIQQLSRKISVISIHHYFSEDQFQQQKNETNDLIRETTANQNVLGNLIRNVPGRFQNLQPEFQKTVVAFSNIHSFANIQMAQDPGKRQEDPEMQKQLLANEAAYMAAMKNINHGFIGFEENVEHNLNKVKDAMISSLFTALIILAIVLIIPIVKLNVKANEKLQASLNEIKKAEQAIKSSEQKYRHLFESNPLPMYIFDVETLRFLEVNERAVQYYGFSREEFSNMTILDIRPEREKGRVQNVIPEIKDNDQMHVMGRWVHQKKNGEEMIVEIITHKIDYHNREALLVLSNDVTKNIRLQQQLLEEKIAKQREIAKATLSVQEKERNEIGKELHDNVNQILTSAKLHMELIESFGAEKHLPKGIELVDTAIKEIRRLSKSLVPPTLNDMGLLPSIEDICENMNILGSMSITFTPINFDEDRFENDFKLTLFRIVQEQLTNIVKHANASEVEITLEQKPELIQLLVEDNGKGFNKMQKRRGIGINNIINRADVYGGVVTINTAEGKGCTLDVRFPVKEKEAQICG